MEKQDDENFPILKTVKELGLTDFGALLSDWSILAENKKTLGGKPILPNLYVVADRGILFAPLAQELAEFLEAKKVMDKIVAEDESGSSANSLTSADIKALEQFEEGRNLLLLGDINSAMAAKLMEMRKIGSFFLGEIIAAFHEDFRRRSAIDLIEDFGKSDPIREDARK